MSDDPSTEDPEQDLTVAGSTARVELAELALGRRRGKYRCLRSP